MDAPIQAAWSHGAQILTAEPVTRFCGAGLWPAGDLTDWLASHLTPGRVAVGIIGYPNAAALAPPLEVLVCEAPRALPAPGHTGGALAGIHFVSDMAHSAYVDAIARIHEYLRAGDCYQVNFARRFSARFGGEAFAAWQQLLTHHPAPHASFFRLASGDCVFGVSPERFLQIRAGKVVSEPIKGSRPRGGTPQQDRQISEDLLNSPKDLAENLMIVDLLRNDLGQVCAAGSVKAEPLFELRRFSNVQHLVSTVSGRLRPDVSPIEALLACFPGGSITGAPKRRAMEIIQELEPVPRGYYCGTQFVLDAYGNLDSNILIRTFQTHGNQIVCHGGGGIVIDSDPQQEYEESLFKVQKLMESLGRQ
ncbi:MAG: anthranilate synthase component I family protein [Alcanivoracaceae bacterium]